jgi:hypothetical protein
MEDIRILAFRKEWQTLLLVFADQRVIGDKILLAVDESYNPLSGPRPAFLCGCYKDVSVQQKSCISLAQLCCPLSRYPFLIYRDQLSGPLL